MTIPWIKIETSLPRKPEVMRLAELLGIDEFTVVGHLICFWSWVDENVSLECPVVNGTTRGLDRVAGRDGFTKALIEVGWLEMADGKVSIPHLDYHLSSGAKTRAVEQRKKAKQREKAKEPPEKPLESPAEVSQNCPVVNGTRSGPEESREEENRNTNTIPPNPQSPPQDPEKTKRRKAAVSVDDEQFARFWTAYPRKLAKGHARKAWAKAIQSADPEQIIMAALAFAKACEGKDSQYVAHPATWLNAERWADQEVQPKKRSRFWWIDATIGRLNRGEITEEEMNREFLRIQQEVDEEARKQWSNSR